MKGPPLPAPKVPHLGAALHAAAQAGAVLRFVEDGSGEREREVSWAALQELSVRAAAALRARGVGPGDRVALVLPTGESFVAAFFAALLCRAVPVPLSPPLRLARLPEYQRATAHLLRASGARHVVTELRLAPLLAPAVLGAEPPIEVLVASQLASHSAEAPRGVASELDLDPDSLALVQFSSGSTSAPKPVALTHRQLVAQLATLHMLMPEVTAGVSWLPLFHDMGLVGCLLSAAYYPAPLTLLRPEAFLARPALWLRALSRTRAEVSPAPNFAFGLCLKRVRDEELEGVDLSSWRYALNGAEPVSPPLLRRFAERFAPFGLAPEALVPVYGLAEAALAVTFSPRRPQVRALALDPRLLALHGRVVPGPREVSSVGLPVPGVEIELRDDTGTPLPERQVGRVTVRGPSVMAHYLGLPEATAEVLRDGWLDTGDLGFAEGGELFICGRSKDVIVIRGANHDPQEFEEAVDAVPGLRAGCAVAVGFEPAGEEAEALLMLVERAKDGAAVASETLAEQVKTAVLERSGIRPHTVELLAPGSLPRTSSGKLRRREALRRYLAAELVAAPLSRGQIALQVAKGAAALWLRGKVSRP